MALTMPPAERVADVWLCESCLQRPADRSVVVDGITFQVCTGCDLTGGAS